MTSRSRCESGTATRGEAPLKAVPSAGPARGTCRDARVVLRSKEPIFRPAGRGHDRESPRRWPSAKAQSEISEPNPYRARHRQPQIIDDGVQPKPTIFALSRACIARGTGSSNPSPSSGESANHRFLGRDQRRRRASPRPRPDPRSARAADVAYSCRCSLACVRAR